MFKKYDVAGLGNALVDTLLVVSDYKIEATGFKRGLMHPIKHEIWKNTYDLFKSEAMEVHAGGSCANTISALGLLGAKAIFRGQVGQDELGKAYADSLIEACGQHSLDFAPDLNTGKVLALVSAEDSERTMLVDLGAAPQLSSLGNFEEEIKQSKVLHVTGYPFFGGPVKDAAISALKVAKQAGITVSFDVADPAVVAVIKDELLEVLKEYVDVVFLNEEEAIALCGVPAEQAVHQIPHVETVVVKLGKKGSLVKHKNDLFEIGVQLVEAVDTTGAGDSYAAGFLYGLVNGWEPAVCGELASRVAALTVSQLGAVYRDRNGLAKAVADCRRML